MFRALASTPSVTSEGWPPCGNGSQDSRSSTVGEIGTSESFQLSVEVREIASLEQRIVAKVNAGDNILGTEGDLLGLGEEVIDTAIEHQAPDRT
jgi:hypothetical protein